MVFQPRSALNYLTFCLFLFISIESNCQDTPKAIQLYEEAWQESSAAERMDILKSFWTEESVFEDPSTRGTGVAALKNIIDKFWKDFPGASFQMDPVLSQGNFHTWTWKLFDKNKNLMLSGVDVAEMNAQGQILHLIGFWRQNSTP